MPNRPKLKLAGTHDPAAIFNDLDALRQETVVPPTAADNPKRRPRLPERFARLPYAKAYALARHGVSAGAWAMIVLLDDLLFQARGRNPFPVSGRHWRDIGLTRYAARQAFRELEACGVVTVRRHPGRSPVVLHHWFRSRDKGSKFEPPKGHSSNPQRVKT
jgi:hypothetical protein